MVDVIPIRVIFFVSTEILTSRVKQITMSVENTLKFSGKYVAPPPAQHIYAGGNVLRVQVLWSVNQREQYYLADSVFDDNVLRMKFFSKFIILSLMARSL